MRQKDQSIETLRGIAIILMVSTHVIGSNVNAGIKVDDDSFFRLFSRSIEFMRLPLFTTISGFVYSLYPLKVEKTFAFLKGKGRRILLPLFFVSSIQYVVNVIVPGTNNTYLLSDIYNIYIYPFGQFWFLQSLFLVFLYIVLFEHLKLFDKLGKYLLVLLGAFAILFIGQHGHYEGIFSFWGSLYLLPFFVLGIGLNKFTKFFYNKITLVIVSVALVAGVLIQQLSMYDVLSYKISRTHFISVFSAVFGLILLFRIRKPWAPLAKVGYYSYGIYLFHVFGTSGMRILLERLSVDNSLILYVLCLFVGIAFPIFAENIILKSKILRRLLLGLK